MKKIVLMVITAYILCVSIGVSEARYYNNDWVPKQGVHIYNVVAAHDFNKYGRNIIIGIEKCNIQSYGNDSYVYAINIGQFVSEKPFYPKQIYIASEYDSVTINAENPRRDEGLVNTIDRIIYAYDTGKVNRVILSAQNVLLIRIITTQNMQYDFYATEDYIRELKQVANWS